MSMAANEERTVQRRTGVEGVLRGSGLTDHPEEFGDGIHSWRCEHPERYGRCVCFTELIDDLAALTRRREVEVLREVALSGYFGTNAQSTLLRLAEELQVQDGTTT